jgi:hypothetical protein
LTRRLTAWGTSKGWGRQLAEYQTALELQQSVEPKASSRRSTPLFSSGLDIPVQRGFGYLEGLANLPHRVKVVDNPQSKVPREPPVKQW